MPETANNPRKVKTVPFRMSFPNILTPRKNDEDGKERYELAMLFPPGTDMAPYKAALAAAMVEKHGDDRTKWPKLRRGPGEVIKDFKAYNDGSNKPLAGDWAGWTMIRANASVKMPPAVVGPIKDASGKFPTVKDPREVYGGRWGRANIEAFFYDRKDGKGVTFGLLNVQLLKNDTKFGNAVSDPNKDFDNADAAWADDADDFGAAPAADKAPATAATGDDWN